MNDTNREVLTLALEILGKYRSCAQRGMDLKPSSGSHSRAGRGGCSVVGVSDAQLAVQAERALEIRHKLSASHSVILGDPVGTGKTPVALTAARLLLERGAVEYALLIAPNKAVAAQWRERAAWAGLTETKQWRPGKLRIVTKKGLPKQVSPSPAETLIIVDEAHRGLQNDKAPIYKRLRPIAMGARLLLVTATPFQLSTSGFLKMLELGSNGSGDKRRASIQNYGTAMTKLLKAWHRAKPDTKEEHLRAAVDKVRRCAAKADAALQLHMLTPYPREKMGIPQMPLLKPTSKEKPKPPDDWLLGYQVARIVPELVGSQGDMFQRRLLSSNQAFWNGAAGKKLSGLSKSKSPINDFVEELRRHLGDELRHPKIAATVAWICRRVKSGQRHVLLFCAFVETQQVLEQELKGRLGQDSVLAPNCAAQLTKDVRARFQSSEAAPLVLVVRDNLSESIDLDGGNPCLVHHDLTWNPARMAQRWGRVVRIRSNFEPVPDEDIFCPVLGLEADQRLFETVSHRRELVDLLVPADQERVWSLLPAEILSLLRSPSKL